MAHSIPEMQTGWASDLMQNETLFLTLDGAMILLAVIILTSFHPAFFFPALSKGKDGTKQKEKKSSVDSDVSEEQGMQTDLNSGPLRD